MNHQAVQRAIRDFRNGKFYAYGKWTPELSLAQKFADENSAEKIIKENGLQDVEVAFVSKDGRRLIGGFRIYCPMEAGS